MQTIGAFLRAARGEKSLGQIAVASGIDKGYLHKVENGARKPKPDRLRALAAAYHVDYGQLMQLSGYDLPGAGSEEALPKEIAVMARKIGELPQAQKQQILRQLNATIDQAVEKLEREERQGKEEA